MAGPATAKRTCDERFREFHSEYSQTGRVLALRRKVEGARGVYAPERIAELTAWFRPMAQENTRFIVLEPPASGKSGTQ